MMNFTAKQIEILKAEFAPINTVNPDHLPRFHAIFAACSDSGLKQLATAGIKFLSKLAVNACVRRGISL